MFNEITEDRFREVCRTANWHITWPADYFAEKKYTNEVFRDLIEPNSQ